MSGSQLSHYTDTSLKSRSASERNPLHPNTDKGSFDALRSQDTASSSTHNQGPFDLLRLASKSREHVLPQHDLRNTSQKSEVSLTNITRNRISYQDFGALASDDSTSGCVVIDIPSTANPDSRNYARNDATSLLGSDHLSTHFNPESWRSASNGEHHIDQHSLRLSDERWQSLHEDGTLGDVLRMHNDGTLREMLRMHNDGTLKEVLRLRELLHLRDMVYLRDMLQERTNRQDNRQRTWRELYQDYHGWVNREGNTWASFIGMAVGIASLLYTVYPNLPRIQ